MELGAFAVLLSTNPFPPIIQGLATAGFLVLLALSIYEHITGQDTEAATQPDEEATGVSSGDEFARTYPLWYSGIDEGIFVLFGYPIVRVFRSDSDEE